MSNEAVLNKGTQLTLEAAGSSSSITNGSLRECTGDDRQPTDSAGYVLGIFEFSTAAGGFSAAPTTGAVIELYEQKINSDGNDAPDVSSNYKQDPIGTFVVKPSDEQQLISIMAPIHVYGGKYWLEWVDGGSGTASIDAGWELILTPCAFGN